ncbi:HAMP domain-containing histidine kinase [Labedella populi]|uniref:histidine kinase n=1 Tax=Labedella populi TaxID=2498850 RepID=A0A3S5CM27_9MICO|nr:HAMP domain-containing sensor histidine kinase [Labedella populi]RWZ64503.1 HAMP domain-containing histidine kinase [Labedella populi]
MTEATPKRDSWTALVEKSGDWWNGISLRTKITGVTVLVLTFGLLIAGIGTMAILKPALVTQVEAQLSTMTESKVSAYIDGDSSAFAMASQNDLYMALYSSDGTLVDRSWSSDDRLAPRIWDRIQFDKALASADAGTIVTTPSAVGSGTEFRGRFVSVYAPGCDSCALVYVAASMRGTDTIVATYLTIFFGLGLGVIVLGALLTRVLVTNTFLPLREVEHTAARIADGDFSQRLSGATPNTEVGRLNRSLNTMLARIDRAFRDRARANEQMRRFVGDASHELRTPLVTVRGYAELYRMGALQKPDDVAQAMERIEKEAIRMGGLVEDLLELARLDETKPLRLERVDLTPIARDAVMDARAASPGRDIRVVIDSPPPRISPARSPEATPIQAPPPPTIAKPRNGTSTATGPMALAAGTLARLRSRRPRKGQEDDEQQLTLNPTVHFTGPTPDVPAIVFAEENKLRQVVANLMGNALRFTPPDSPLEVGVSADPILGRATIAVIDHGEGIPLQIRDKIFQRFWRADSSRTRETGGSGLGLSIVASIIAAHHGTVTVVETPGGGATFRVELPLAPPPLPDDGPLAVPVHDASADAQRSDED